MKTIERRFIDKSDWPRGPWHKEPDKVQWQDEATGLPCLAVRTKLTGALCGYVGVAAGHPAFGECYDALGHIDVHGGLTYSDHCNGDEERGVCHTPDPGEPEHAWWVGFDCAHCGDVTPAMAYTEEIALALGGAYRTLDYVQDQCRLLAQQLAATAI